MKILIISGFLGAGKTTFIKELIHRTDKNIVVMENEFGNTSLDADSISESGINVLEFMEGCVCCTMKDSFVNSVLTISATLDPEYLVVEPTGAAELSAMMSSLRRICYGNISLVNPVTVVSAAGFSGCRSSSIYNDQLANSKIIVLSKTENADNRELEYICKEIREINPEAEIITENYKNKSDEWWNGLFGTEHITNTKIPIKPRSETLEEHTVKGRGFHNIAELIELLRGSLWGYYGNVMRAKGEVQAGGEWVHFELADGMYSIVGENTQHEQQCVFIGKGLNVEKLDSRFSDLSLS